MARPKYDRPTDAEIAILCVIWDRGPSTVTEVKQALSTQKTWIKQSSVLKLMQIMVGKRLLKRDDSKRPQIYHSAVIRQKLQNHLVLDLAKRAFGGSVEHLIATASYVAAEEQRKAAAKQAKKAARRQPAAVG